MSNTASLAVVQLFFRKTIVFGGLCALLICTASIAAFAVDAPISNPVALLPSTTSAVCSVDSNWLWNSTAKIRAQPKAVAALAQVAAMSGLSIDSDVIPWLGRVVLANPVASTDDNSKMIVMAEIKDSAAFANCFLKINSALAGKAQLQKTDVVIDGRTVTKISTPNPGVSIYLTIQKNWLVIGYGDGSIATCIAAWNGTAPNLTTNVAFTKIFNRLTTSKAVAWAVGDPKPFMKYNKAAVPEYGSMFNGILGAELVDLGSGMSIKTVAYYTSDTGRTLLRQMAAAALPITGASLKTIPNQASAAMIIGSPAHWIGLFSQEYSHFVPTANVMQMQMLSGVLQQYKALYAPLTGETVISGTFVGGDGGVTMSAGTASYMAANGVATRIAQTISPMIPSLTRSGNQWSIAPPRFGAAPVVSPAMRIHANYLQLTSSPKWLDAPEGSPSLTMPPDAIGSISVLLVNFSHLGEIIEKMTQGQPAGNNGGKEFFDSLLNNGIQHGSLASWSTLDPASNTAGSMTRLTNVNWKGIVNDLVIAGMNAPPPAPATVTPAIPAVPPTPPPPTVGAPMQAPATPAAPAVQ